MFARVVDILLHDNYDGRCSLSEIIDYLKTRQLVAGYASVFK
jgi:hypothetical protein